MLRRPWAGGIARIERLLAIPQGKVWGCFRRFAGLAGRIREVFTGVAAAVSADPVPLPPAGVAIADAVVQAAAAE